MSLCPTINISPYNIVGDGDNISVKIDSEMVKDAKNMYGIDLENKKLLAHLKKYGAIKITASACQSLIDSCQTEAELDAEDEIELNKAKEKFFGSSKDNEKQH